MTQLNFMYGGIVFRKKLIIISRYFFLSGDSIYVLKPYRDRVKLNPNIESGKLQCDLEGVGGEGE